MTPVGPLPRASTALAETAELVDKGFTVTVHLTRPLDVPSVEAAKQRLKHSMSEFFSEIYKVMLPGRDETTAIDVRFRSTDVRDDVIAHLQEELGPVSLWTDRQHEKRVQQDQDHRARMEAVADGFVSAREALPALDRWVQNMAGGKRKHLRAASRKAVEVVHAGQAAASEARKKPRVESSEDENEAEA